jgi:hypothetical protein
MAQLHTSQHRAFRPYWLSSKTAVLLFLGPVDTLAVNTQLYQVRIIDERNRAFGGTKIGRGRAENQVQCRSPHETFRMNRLGIERRLPGSEFGSDRPYNRYTFLPIYMQA